jgi:predicted RNA-binding Zn ribbon-like protein
MTPASNSTELVRGYVNSVYMRRGVEHLTTVTAANCLHRLSLAASDQSFTEDQIALLVGVREGIRGLLLDHAGRDVPPGSSRDLDRLLGDVPVVVTWADGRMALKAVRGDVAHRVVAAVLTAVINVPETEWTRLKVCDRDGCRWAFYDRSRNRSGRWCEMSTCGNIEKMRRAYQTRKHSAPA